MEKSKSQSYYHWVIVACGVILLICNAGSSNLLGTAMPFIREKAGLNYSQVSFLQTTRSTAYMVGTVISAMVYDKITLRMGCMVGFILAISGGLLYGSGNSFPVFIAAATLMGMGNGLGGAMPAAVLMKRWFDKRLGFVQGIVAAGSSITGLVFTVPFAMLCRSSGVFSAYRTVEIVVAVGAVIFFVLARNFPEEKGLLRYGEGEEEDPSEAEKTAKKKAPRKSSFGPVKPMSKADNAMLYFMVACISVMTMCGWNYFTVAATGVGYENVFVASISTLYSFVSLMARPAYGAASDRFGNIRATYVVFALIIAGHICLGLMNGTSMVFIVAAGVLLGCSAMSPNQVGLPIWTSALKGDKEYTKSLKNMKSFFSFVSLFMMPIAGMVADRFGGYRPVFFFISALSIVPPIIITYLYSRYVPKSTVEEKGVLQA